ncbi:hypothetical protein L596_026620 [Steinernema carpocapsae]|uniref:Uncharacterized protein n=1 Tax=Steinernema carpocapsae TaxID=34508 RepID=A0A4U5M1W5_STECR|nr:hypothetical protein L596_026620 [Steinernema carpocapsae]
MCNGIVRKLESVLRVSICFAIAVIFYVIEPLEKFIQRDGHLYIDQNEGDVNVPISFFTVVFENWTIREAFHRDNVFSKFPMVKDTLEKVEKILGANYKLNTRACPDAPWVNAIHLKVKH